MIVTGAEFVCPECGQPLDRHQLGRGGFPWRIVSYTMALLLISTAWAVHQLEPNSPGHTTPRTAVNQGSVILRLSGANRIGLALSPSLAVEFLKQQGANEVETFPGSQEDIARVQGILPGESSPSSIEIQGRGYYSAFENLVRGTCDVGLVFREIKPKEPAQLGLSETTSPVSEHLAGLDDVALIVSRKNAVESLTKKQVSLVFGGDIRDWSQVGGSSGAINVYFRKEKSGTPETFKSLVLGDKPLSASAHLMNNNREISDKVAQDPNGIGVISVENIREAKPIAIFDDGATAFLPNQLNVATGDTPLTRCLTLFIPANAHNILARRFVEFALSHQGQQIAEKSGFIGQGLAPTYFDMLHGRAGEIAAVDERSK